MSRTTHRYTKGFSVIIAIMITAFLTILSAGILGTIMEEAKSTRIVYDSIRTYEGAMAAKEYALLKIRNHREGFQDSIDQVQDNDSNLLAQDPANPKASDMKIWYQIENSSLDHSGTVAYGEFEMIPLFQDKGSPHQTFSRHPNKESFTGTNVGSFQLVGGSGFVWNIVGNDADGNTFGISGTGSAGKRIGGGGSFIVDDGTGVIKRIEDDFSMTDSKLITFSSTGITQFLASYDDCYLILYNYGKDDLEYNLKTDSDPFGLPKLRVISSGRIMKFKQNILFEESRNKYFDAIKYSIFNRH